MYQEREEARRWQTESGRVIFEYQNNEYLWHADDRKRSLMRNRGSLDPNPSEGAPLAVSHDWPDHLENEPVFQYLLPDHPTQQHRGFRDFIKNWRRSSCALLYYSSDEDPKIIGTGCSIGEDRVVTARHHFQNIDLNRLYVRFSLYTVSYSQDSHWWIIHEPYIDVPVLHVEITRDNLDAGFLILPPLGPSLRDYRRLIPFEINSFDTRIPAARYVLFHFAGTIPQVSVGHVRETTFGSNLNNEIDIQGGPLASGGVLIRENFNRVEGVGLFIYRMLREGFVDRRIIPFSRMSYPGCSDEISAPYGQNRLKSFFRVIPSDALAEKGYEFVHYFKESPVSQKKKYENPGYRIVGPNGHLIAHPQNYSNHHIIPLDDLLFLWDYYHSLDPKTEEAIRTQVAEKNARVGQNHEGPLDQNQMIKASREETIQKFYGRAQSLMEEISSLIPFKHPLYPLREAEYRFAWSPWNLFQGWNPHFRTDDPLKNALRYGLNDLSEKKRPHHFHRELWNQVKILHHLIQELKRNKRNPVLEAQTDAALKAIRNTWVIMLGSPPNPYPFNPDEWVCQGKTRGHPLYCLFSPT